MACKICNIIVHDILQNETWEIPEETEIVVKSVLTDILKVLKKSYIDRLLPRLNSSRRN